MNNSLAKAFGSVLKELRNEAGISQENLAYECELDRSFISMLERGLRIPTLETLFKISTPLNKAPFEIIKMMEQKVQNK
ncbi:MAG: family transcriptional regulator [Ferruginibacter sp.]|uniref:helix-turn-helix domain-containing protein n=1 Tax=Ferruginibacter sp. TaxID=1940288 RepID=UPI00265914BF|nr:helix-turn-helix transcriptional regulator [Ferruginibacter sp.]MDB5275445.1 family transcriptional regulator [Ferruginibacter sp.]